VKSAARAGSAATGWEVADVQGKHPAGGTIQPLVAIFRFRAYGHGSDMSGAGTFGGLSLCRNAATVGASADVAQLVNHFTRKSVRDAPVRSAERA
jgi:hypothetical protein